MIADIPCIESLRAFFAAAKAFFENAEALENEAQGLGNTISRVIHAGCFVTLAAVIIPTMSHAFSEIYPQSRISFVEGHQAALLDSVRDGIIQIAFTYKMSIGRDLVFEPLGEVAPYCIVPLGHRLAGAGRIDLSEMTEDPMVFLDLPKSREYYLSLFDKAKVSAMISHRTTSPEVVRVMVAHGLGYSILAMPTTHSVAMDGTGLVMRPLAGDFPNHFAGLLANLEAVTTHTYEAVHEVAKTALASILLPV